MYGISVYISKTTLSSVSTAYLIGLMRTFSILGCRVTLEIYANVIEILCSLPFRRFKVVCFRL